MNKKIILLFSFFTTVFSNAQEIVNDTISHKLDEVVLEKKTKAITFKNGNTKIDVANSNFSSISNTPDLLAKLPKVQLSSDRTSVSIIGKGNPVIYIDNQSATMDDVNSLAVAEIKTIEIINNPSSKYEASGRAVILITRKRSRKEGFKTDFSENASFKKGFNNYLGMNSSFKKEKVEFKANLNYNRLNPWESNGISTEIKEIGFYSDYLAVALTKRLQVIFGGGFFYKINEDDYLSVAVSNRVQKEDFGINTNSFYRDNSTLNDVLTHSDNRQNRNFLNSFVNYNKRLKKWNTVVFSGIQYSNYSQEAEGSIENNYNSTSFIPSQKRSQDYAIQVLSGRVDVEKNFNENSKLEFGFFGLSSATSSGLMVHDYENNTDAVSLYDYKENNGAVYSQFSGKILKADYSIGIRAEKTNSKGKFNNESDFLIDKNYTNLFPKAQLEFSIDSTKTITINYSKSIVRPNYSATTQGSTYINPYFIFTNNINLNPTFTDEIAAALQRKEASVTLRYTKTKNSVYYGFAYDDALNSVIFMPTNFDEETGFSVELAAPFKYKFWSSNVVLASSLNTIADDSAVNLDSKPSVYFYLDQTIEFPKKYVFGINSWAISKRNEGVFVRNGLFVFNLSLSKRFFDSWDFSLGWNDVFRKMNPQERLNINHVSTNGDYFTNTNEFSIGLRYSFGRIKDSSYKEKIIDENTGRIR